MQCQSQRIALALMKRARERERESQLRKQRLNIRMHSPHTKAVLTGPWLSHVTAVARERDALLELLLLPLLLLLNSLPFLSLIHLSDPLPSPPSLHLPSAAMQPRHQRLLLQLPLLLMMLMFAVGLTLCVCVQWSL